MAGSRDGGRSWETRDVDLPTRMPHIAQYGERMVLHDGTFIVPAWGRFDLNREPKYVSSLVLRTADAGDTWHIATVAKALDFDFNETAIAEAANGDLVAVIRTTQQRELWTAVSTDGGGTWSEPRDSGMRGSTPWAVTTPDGLVVAVYIRRSRNDFSHTGAVACVSRDNGHTWESGHELLIHDCGSTTVDGYPSAVALPDGSVFAVYGHPGASALTGTRFGPR